MPNHITTRVRATGPKEKVEDGDDVLACFG